MQPTRKHMFLETYIFQHSVGHRLMLKSSYSQSPVHPRQLVKMQKGELQKDDEHFGGFNDFEPGMVVGARQMGLTYTVMYKYVNKNVS